MLTKKQIQLLDFIQKRMARDGVPPSFDEMKDALDLRSKSGIHRLITALEERGFIRRLAHRARAIEVIRLPEALTRQAAPAPSRSAQVIRLPTPPQVAELPLMGRIAAGVPIEAISEVLHHVTVPDSMIGRGEHYALEVKGDSMINAGINDGDIVIIREGAAADNGDIVVALVEEEEATLKRLRRQNGMIAL